jgi:hypothetical protein
MAFGMRRTDLQSIAQIKVDDALILLQHSRFSNAYYLAGYAVEIGLKAYIARTIFSETIPDQKFISAINTHKLRELISLAGLSSEFKTRQDSDSNFGASWAIVAQWGPEKRYELIDPMTSQLMVQSVVDPNNGVFPWIKAYW